MKIKLPHRNRGRQSAEAERKYQSEIAAFCAAILQIGSGLDFKVSSRGWCYILEEHGLTKGDFDAAQRLINECRKSGDLPLDISAVDEGRSTECLENINDRTPEDEAENWVEYLRENAQDGYTPISFWEGLDNYVEMTVEKIDLVGLFQPVCNEFHVALTNVAGWNDINTRVAIMRRFQPWERQGKRCVLLHCGDHDPGGLHISDFLRSNFVDLTGAVGWSPDDLKIDRFGLNADFIRRHRLTWIDNLETSSGGRLDDPRHPDHLKPYVQSYLRRFGARKVEANALVVRAQAGRALCRQAILKYVPEDAPAENEARLAPLREEMQQHIIRLLAEAAE
jgi:hypothetical protein